MKTPTHDERAAEVLATASVIGDQRAAERHMCSERSVKRWRALCEEDESLALAVSRKRAELTASWAKEVPAAILAAIAFLTRAAEQADPSDPEAIHAVAGAMKLLAEAEALHHLLDAQLATQTRQNQPEPLALVAAREQLESDRNAS